MNSRLALPLSLALICLGAPPALQAQGAEPAPEILARDMREEVVRIDVTVKDMYNRQETRRLPITIYRPPGDGPFPVVVFNHGRATEARRAAQTRFRPEHAARYLVAKGFVVLAPTRLGYWENFGDFDPEYSGGCGRTLIEPMSTAASDQVLAAIEFARTLPYADPSRWLVAGISVGGLAAVATVGRKPNGLLAGINFAGGAGGDPEKNPGRPCNPGAISHYWGRLAGSAGVPMLWLYWKNDKYWGEEIPRGWHKAWVDGGGRADLKVFPPAGEDGHSGLSIDMNTWLPVVDEFLNQLGFTQAAIVPRPAASGFAELGDISKVPVSESGKTNGYPKFLASKSPRAFAVGERGGWGYATGDYATGKAIGFCQRSGQSCRLYAVDDDVVWRSDGK